MSERVVRTFLPLRAVDTWLLASGDVQCNLLTSQACSDVHAG